MQTWTVPGYTEQKELGKGGSGRVVLGTHTETGTPVAIKYLADDLSRDEYFLGEFRTEAEVLSRLASPFVTRMYEYIEADGHAAIVMELVEGVTMRAVLREKGPVEPEAALVVLKGSLLGLATAHQRKVVHRDYKPENVLVDLTGQSKLADFGIAARSGGMGIHAGTPNYMAPEQWNGDAASPRTDIYAVTATFFECLTGKPPFTAPGDRDRLREMHASEPVPLDRIPMELHRLAWRGLAKDPDQRYRDAATFLRELEAVATDKYGPEWEAEGRRQLARRVAMLALLIPRPPGEPPVTSSAFAWTKLGRRALTAAAAMVVVAGLAMHVTTGGENGHPAADILPATTVPAVAPIVAPPSPSPSPSPSLSPSPSASPSQSKKPKKPTPKPKPKASPSASSSSPAPSPIRTVVVGGQTNSDDLNWSVTVRAFGTGPAVLRLAFYPITKAGDELPDPTLTPPPFEETVSSASSTWTGSVATVEACGDYLTVKIKATVTFDDQTVASESAQITCYVFQ